MASNPYVNRVDYVAGGVTHTLIDITSDTVTPSTLLQGYTAHDASGAAIVGTSTAGTMVIRDTQDSHGGTVREITAGSVVTGTKTITANGTYDVAEFADASVNVPSAEPALQAKTATPTETQQTVTPDSGYDGLSQVTVGAISSSYVGSGITRRSSSNLTASGATITAPAGYYASAASKSVATGSATASATKGSVSNHSIAVTPSVTRTAGYITAGSADGTAVTVSASELVSGSQTITENGTVDVTNLASVDVDVSGASSTRTAIISRSDGYSIPRVQVNGTGTTYSANEAQFTWEDGDTLRFYYGASTYFGYTYVNGVLIHSSASGGYYTYTPPKCDIDIQFMRNTSQENSYVYITYPYLEITSAGVYDVSNYCGVVVNILE